MHCDTPCAALTGIYQHAWDAEQMGVTVLKRIRKTGRHLKIRRGKEAGWNTNPKNQSVWRQVKSSPMMANSTNHLNIRSLWVIDYFGTDSYPPAFVLASRIARFLPRMSNAWCICEKSHVNMESDVRGKSNETYWPPCSVFQQCCRALPQWCIAVTRFVRYVHTCVLTLPLHKCPLTLCIWNSLPLHPQTTPMHKSRALISQTI